MSLKKNPKYDLKRKYNRFLETGLIITLVIIIAAFKLIPSPPKVIIKSDNPGELITVCVIPITKNDIPKRVKPELPKTIVEAPDDAELLDEIEVPGMDDYTPIQHAPVYKEKDEKYVEPPFIEVAEKMPFPVGGMNSIYKKIVYPQIAIKAGVTGLVVVEAFVDEDGNVIKTVLKKGIGAGCDEEALKAVQETKFNPGKQRDRPVKVKMKIPIRFILR